MSKNNRLPAKQTSELSLSSKEFSELASHLRGTDEESEASIERSRSEFLYQGAVDLLSKDSSQHATINGIKAITTKHAYPVNIDGQQFYARLARQGEDTSPFVVFGETDSATDIHSASPTALKFATNDQGRMSVFINQGLEGMYDDSRYVRLMGQVVEKIGEQTEIDRKLAEERKHRIKRGLGAAARGIGRATGAPRRFYTDNWDGSTRRKWTAGLLITAGVLYGPVPFDNHPDATVGGFPMPTPIELIVDLANMPDHKAQNYAAPEGALNVAVGQPINEVPLLVNYRSNGVPDASNNAGTNPEGGLYGGEHSKPGLYVSDFDFAYYPETGSEKDSAQFHADGCYDIDGDYTAGTTKIFTQTPDLNKIVHLNVEDPQHLSVCKNDPNAKVGKGSIYVYQKP
jgi:hypothetical protein